MSASLVGSEMCIRDRTPTLQVACNLARQCVHARYGHMLQTGYSPHILRCLLYTSDAADDM
eukprot:8638162-Alexandrium_andersonii.AAC.1